MKIFIALALFVSSLFASKILGYNVYERTDRADIMFTFDKPFTGSLKQMRQKNRVILQLSDVSIESPKVKNISSEYLQKLTLTPIAGATQIIATVPDNVEMSASKTSDAYGLRLRFYVPKSTSKTSQATPNTATNISSLPTKPNLQFNTEYLIVIVILSVAIVVLLLIKRQMGTNTSAKTKSSWPFKSKKAPQPNIRFQKALDQKNKVIMLDFEENSYLLLVGNSNVILDKFRDDEVVDDNGFNQVLQREQKQIDEYMRVEDKSGSRAYQPFSNSNYYDSYKEKASLMSEWEK
jgi:NADH:ubiquinone oxidoreductase subunit 3 (subunit A)